MSPEDLFMPHHSPRRTKQREAGREAEGSRLSRESERVREVSRGEEGIVVTALESRQRG